MTTQTEQQFQFFRLLFKINTKQDLRGLLNFLVQQQTTEKKQENHRQLVNKTKLFVEFLETHPTLKLDYDLGINKGCNLWNYCEDNPNKSDYNINDLVVNIYKYADSISKNIEHLSVFHKDLLDEIILFLHRFSRMNVSSSSKSITENTFIGSQKGSTVVNSSQNSVSLKTFLRLKVLPEEPPFPITQLKQTLLENVKTLQHRRELKLFVCFLDEILVQFDNDTFYHIRGNIFRVLYEKNNQYWRKLQCMGECTDDIKDWYKILKKYEPALYKEMNEFFDYHLEE